MSITIEDVEKIAKLAKLKKSQEEKEKFTQQLGDILKYMEKLNEVDTENVEPTHHVHDVTNVFREDKVEPWLSQEEATANAPKKFKGHFSVPKVIDRNKDLENKS